MSVKLLGWQYKAFLNDNSVWLRNYWYEADSVTIDGAEVSEDYDESKLPDTAKVVVDGGVFYRGDAINSPCDDYEKVLRKWLKDQTTTSLAIEFPKERIDEVKSLLNSHNIKVVR